jgi:predicted nucleic acid-binding protein
MAQAWQCYIPNAVYRETVTRGKEESYPDAVEIERAVAAHMEVRRATRHPQAERLLTRRRALGAGEREALRLYFSLAADGIVSDDAAFERLLYEAELPVIPPAAVLVMLARERHLSSEKALESLTELKGLIRAEVYQEARRDLELLTTEKGDIS